jgi:queuine/archaeosine tRNA-ribosyltransferase
LITRAVVWVTVPDYPDDYHPKSLWISENYTNIERTLDNVLYYTVKYPNINWLIPIQGHNKKPESVIKSITLYEEHGILDKYDYYGIANLCVEPDTEIIYQTVKLAKEKLPGKKLHVFGLKLPAVRRIHHLIHSFDSVAWTRPVNDRVVNYGKRYSAKNKEQRIRFFEEWLRRLEAITRKNTSIEQYIKNG